MEQNKPRIIAGVCEFCGTKADDCVHYGRAPVITKPDPIQEPIKKIHIASEKEITVIIPCRETENAYKTLSSLAYQTLQNFNVIIVFDEGKGANWARNQGFKHVDTPFVLFSDNDIAWDQEAIETLTEALKNSGASYAYGSYEMDSRIYCNNPFDAETLKKGNYISTMSLIRTADFPGFDENIKRLQDWDLWLTMLGHGQYGISCGKKIFTTAVRSGITFGKNISYDEAALILKIKHNL